MAQNSDAGSIVLIVLVFGFNYTQAWKRPILKFFYRMSCIYVWNIILPVKVSLAKIITLWLTKSVSWWTLDLVGTVQSKASIELFDITQSRANKTFIQYLRFKISFLWFIYLIDQKRILRGKSCNTLTTRLLSTKCKNHTKQSSTTNYCMSVL